MLEPSGQLGSSPKVNVNVVRSARTNQLGVDAGQFTTYGVLKAEADTSRDKARDARKPLLELLNNILNSGRDGVITPEQVGSRLSFADAASGQCGSLGEEIHVVHGKGDKLFVSVGGSGQLVDHVCEKHPMVAGLNALLDAFWGWPHIPYDGGAGREPTCSQTQKVLRLPRSDPRIKGLEQKMEQETASMHYPCVNYGWSEPIGLTTVPNSKDTSYPISEATGMSPWWVAPAAKAIVRSASEPTSLKLTYGKAVGQSIDTTGDDLRPSMLEPFVTMKDKAEPQCFRFGITPSAGCAGSMADPKGLLKGAFTEVFGKFSQDDKGWLTFQNKLCGSEGVFRYDGSRGYPPIQFVRQDLLMDGLCVDTFEKSGGPGRFHVDEETGRLVYYAADNDCVPQELKCLQFCPNIYPLTRIPGTVSAGAFTYGDEWPNEYASPTRTAWDFGERGKWRLKRENVYQTDIAGLSQPYSASKWGSVRQASRRSPTEEVAGPCRGASADSRCR
jgi:hypothetical protein